MNEIIYPELSYKICGLCFDIHNKLGRFRSEKSYADALDIALQNTKISFVREISLMSSFIGEADRRNIPDFIIDNKIVIDLKAKRLITKEDYYQMKRYLDTSRMRLGLIINFRQHYLKPKRIVNGYN